MAEPTNHSPLIDEADPAQSVYLCACALVFLLSHTGKLSKNGRVGRRVRQSWVQRGRGHYRLQHLERAQRRDHQRGLSHGVGSDEEVGGRNRVPLDDRIEERTRVLSGRNARPKLVPERR